MRAPPREERPSSDARALADALRARASQVGFARVGFARAEPLEPEGERLRRWVAAGRHGTMHWLEETVEVRIDPTHPRMLPTARSVVALAMPYARPDETGEPTGPTPGQVARYARGRDYHNVLRRRARKLARWLQRMGYRTRVSVDSEPVWERAWAVRAGLGFAGKNCCLIVPGLGSHVLLACLVTEAPLPPDTPLPERCGSCRACLDACPTDALTAPRQLDANRCISYLTIEHDGTIPHGLRVRLNDHFFGCDACQDVCPFNRTRPAPLETTAPFASHPERWRLPLRELLAMQPSRFLQWAHGSPLRRAGLRRLQRNAAIVLSRHGTEADRIALHRTATRHPDEHVRETAHWALERLRSEGGVPPAAPGHSTAPSPKGDH